MPESHSHPDEAADPSTGSAQALRKQAEEIAGADQTRNPEPLSPEAARQVVHELRVHQIELEMQNEELRRTQAELEASRARYFDLYDLAPVGYVTLSEQGVILEANLTASAMFEMSRSALVKTPVSRYIFAEDQDIHYRHRKQLFETGAPQVCELRMVRHGGAQFWARLNATTAQDGESGLPVWRMVLSDITDRKRAEEQLREVQKMAALGTLTGGVAHHFNNMLTSIIGFAHMALDEDKIGREASGLLRQITEVGWRAAKLVSQLTAFSRQSILAMRPVDLSRLIAEAVESLRTKAPGNVSIRFQYVGDEAVIIGDKGHLMQVFLGLCDNGVKAMPDGGELLLRLEPTVLSPAYSRLHDGITPGEYFCVSIRDTGMGIPVEAQRHLFEPFFTTREVGEGTGLGLAMAYGLVGQHGGLITFSSDVGRGSEFQVYLPVVRQEGTRTGAAAVDPGETEGEILLLIEEDEMVMNVAKALLESLGYRVISAAARQAGLEICRARGEEIALVLVDVVDPGGSGLEFFGRLRKVNPAVRVILISCIFLDREREDLRARGLAGFVQKPFDPVTLDLTVRQALRGRDAHNP